MEMTSRQIGAWKVLAPAEKRLDALISEEFKSALLEAIQDGTRRLLIDFARVEFMDSSGLGALVCCLQRMGEGRIVIAGARGAVALMLRLTQIDKVFTLVEDIEDITRLEEYQAG
jgi:anti-sigma B factor antagonist